MRRLSAIDAQFLYVEDVAPAVHQHTIKVSILAPAENGPAYAFDDAREHLRRRLHLLPPFRWRLVSTPLELHHPVWIEDPGFDLDFHVRRAALPAPGGTRELCEFISDVLSRPLDRAKPLWELYLVEGLEDDRVAAVAKVHHALADGVASAEMLDLFFDTAADTPPPGPDHWQPEAMPTKARLAYESVRDVGSLLATRLPQIVRTMRAAREGAAVDGLLISDEPPKLFTAPPTPFNKPLTPHRTFALLSVDLDEVKAVKAAFGTTLNDVVLAVAAGALRQYLLEHGHPADQPLVGGMPVSTRTDEERGAWGNRLAQLSVYLPVDVEDPIERLYAAKRAADAAKAELAATLGRRIENIIEVLPLPALRSLGRLIIRRARAGRHIANLVVSNVPGPRQPLYVEGGKVERFFSVGPLHESVGLNLTAWSYVDQLNVSMLACRELMPDLWRLADLLRAELTVLSSAADFRYRA